ncbi:MAG: GTP 3',8-cyclase MoaA [Candidatus Binatia bacterium]|nr:GTP 3',8-cyclase MoaA [Candidatus Binatia bacterium]MDG1958693.1 GTP 3',8-cyclase MoaA [Candidatus Binatia bacterium]MDG2008998.1 GTP 3',8-cyclase MoaA [Candidatus Binatia bacterium]
MPLDRFHREIDYLRISLTDHCNLRCVYCMPLGEVPYADREEILTADEIESVVTAAAGVGFRRIRFTGGEPTLRPDLVEIVSRCSSVDGINDVAMTTNGILLPPLAEALREAGLDRVNIHVDSLREDSLPKLMRRGTAAAIRAGIEAAVEAGFSPLKLNCVVTGGLNDTEVVDLALLTRDNDWHVRFIELMPLGGGECAEVSRSRFVSNVDTQARIETALGRLEALPRVNPADESANYQASGFRGVIGFISPVSAPYCGTCNRMRLTSDGRFHLCLLHDDELDVRRALRAGANTEKIGEILLHAVGAKPTGHALERGVEPLQRAMHHLGG